MSRPSVLATWTFSEAVWLTDLARSAQRRGGSLLSGRLPASRFVGYIPARPWLYNDSPLQLSPGVRLGPYEIQAAVGAGGMGEVYRARDTRLDRTVAIKVLLAALGRTSDARARFGREARAISALNHPHICTLYDIGHEQGFDYLVMEYLDGEPLNRRIGEQPVPGRRAPRAGDPHRRRAGGGARERHPASRSQAREPVRHIARPGEDSRFRRGQDRRRPRGRGRLDERCAGRTADRSRARRSAPSPTCRPSNCAATPWMRGPICSRSAPCSTRWRPGHRAFEGSTTAVIFEKIINRAPVSLAQLGPGFPAELERIITRCLEQSVIARYQRARDVLDDLRALKRARESGITTSVGPAVRVMPSIAVLAFVDMSPQKDQDYFCEGMAEELINVLTTVPGIRVASRTSAFQFKGKAVDVSDIGARLRVDSVLEGSVRKAGNRLRITAQLVNAQRRLPSLVRPLRSGDRRCVRACRTRSRAPSSTS